MEFTNEALLKRALTHAEVLTIELEYSKVLTECQKLKSNKEKPSHFKHQFTKRHS